MSLIARVALDQPLAHLDHPFDYVVPEELADQAVVGARVRVRFAGRKTDGWIVALSDSSEFGKLSPLQAVVSSEPLMRPELVKLIRAVADHYAGTFADVMRLAVPPRHARTEKSDQREWPKIVCDIAPRVLSAYPTGEGFLSALERGESPRAFWQVAPTFGPSGDWETGFAEAANATRRSGRSALCLVPNEADLEFLRARLADWFGAKGVGVLHGGLGSSTRYRNYLAAARGEAWVLVGTRAAAFAPMPNLGLIAMWDDGDDLYAEPHAPYPHARQVVGLRTVQQGNALLLASHARSAEAQAWLDHGWLLGIETSQRELRAVSPAVRVSADSDYELARDPLADKVRLPSRAFEVLRAGLAQGPVLVQVPRAGYAVSLACDVCRTPARCTTCQGPLRSAGERSSLECAWCGRLQSWRCPTCGGTKLRAPRVGAVRTAQELARAFPGVLAVNSSGDQVRREVPDEPAIVVATPGGEPRAPTGYAAALLLDTALLTTRNDLRAGEEALRRWLRAIALVRPGADGGTVLAVGESADPYLQFLVRLDPAAAASRELADRNESGFPPAVKLIRATGPRAALSELLALGDWVGIDVLGPVDGDPASLILRCPLADGPRLVGLVKAAMAERSAKKMPGALRVQVDPQTIG